MTNPAIAHAMSVDVEDYFQVEAFANVITPEMWPDFEWRVVENTKRVLDLLAGCRATFFVLGSVAERFPALVRQIADAGHEIASHGHMHAPVWRLSRDQFREDARRARMAIEDAAGCRVIGYRAPTFSITPDTVWALQMLAEEGFLYDSSVFPIQHDRYGMPNAPRFPFKWKFPDGGTMLEVPMSTVRIFGRNLPVTGGGYLRILPLWYSRWTLQRLERQERRPAVVYFHPWEIDPDQPRVAVGRLKSLRHYCNLKETEKRLRTLMKQRTFLPISELFRDMIPADSASRCQELELSAVSGAA